MLIDFKNKPSVKIWDGINGPIAYSENITFGYLTIENGSELPVHQHPHEQWSHLIEGEFIFNIDGIDYNMKPGMSVYIKGNLPHSGKALTKCIFLDCFNPPREDWTEKEKEQLR